VSDGVRIILPGVLREFADGLGELDVPVADGTTSLRSVLDAALVTRPRLGARIRDETGALRRHVNVFVDGQDVRSAGGLEGSHVGPGSVIHILPSIAGG
jgi:molybdopterin synthase sulfur carrier subunit